METMSEGTPDFSNDSLQPVSFAIIEEYIKELKSFMPDSIHIYSFLYILLKWKRKRPSLNFFVLAPKGDVNQGMVVCLIDQEFTGTIYAKDEETAKTLQNALESTKRFPFLIQNKSLFTSMLENSYRALENVVSGPDWCKNEDVVFWLPWYVAREMEIHIPEDVEIRELTAKNVKQINEIWPHRYNNSDLLIKEIIEINFGLGVFKGDKLVSWALLWFYGGIGVVQTEEGEKRKGYARAVVEAVTKRMGELQIDVHLNVVEGNKPALAFFEALGFRYAFPSIWASKGYHNKEKSV